MKNGQWVAEWKGTLRPFEAYTKKNDPGPVFNRVFDSESLRIEKTLKVCDARFKAFFATEEDKRGAALKSFGGGVDDYEKCQKGLCKSIKKLAAKKDKAFVKVVDAVASELDKIQDSVDTVIFGMVMDIKHRARQKKKSGSVAQDLTKACTDAKAWVKKLGKKPEVEDYRADINEYADDIFEELVAMLKMTKKDKKLGREMRPDSKWLKFMRLYGKKDVLFLGDTDVKPEDIFGVLKDFADEVTVIDKWNQKTWVARSKKK